MQKAILIVILLSLCRLMSAQLTIGPKVSFAKSFVNSSEQLYDNNQNLVIYRLELNRQQVFPSIGIVGNYRFTNSFANRYLSAFVQLESLFTYRRTHFTFENYLSNADQRISTIAKGVSFVRFPVLGGLSYRSFKFGVGPIFSFRTSEEKVFDLYPNIEERYRSFEPSASALIGYRVDDFILDISYEYHFNGVSEFIYYKNKNGGFKDQPHYLALNATYLFRTRY